MNLNISDTLYERLMKESKEDLLEIMLEALDNMQGYNNQSITRVICLAMNAEETENESGQTAYRFPKKDTDNG